jgi:hypothetical protein
VASAIKAKLSKAIIDCRSEDGNTELFDVYLLKKTGDKEKVYSGDNKTTREKID